MNKKETIHPPFPPLPLPFKTNNLIESNKKNASDVIETLSLKPFLRVSGSFRWNIKSTKDLQVSPEILGQLVRIMLKSVSFTRTEPAHTGEVGK